MGWCYRKRLVRLPYPPLSMWIESTNACNLQCEMCSRDFSGERKQVYIEEEIFKNIFKCPIL